MPGARSAEPGWPDTALLGSTVCCRGDQNVSIIGCCSHNYSRLEDGNSFPRGILFLEEKSLNTQKPLRNKTSRTQTIGPSQDGGQTVQCLPGIAGASRMGKVQR